MFDKMKKMFKKKDGESQSSPQLPRGQLRRLGSSPHIWTMPPSMQEQFKKGVRYDMKVVIRGMRMTGKSSLLARLHGRPVEDQYTPSAEISAATIRFQGKEDPDEEGVKIDFWDVVDEGTTTEQASPPPWPRLGQAGGSARPCRCSQH